MSKSKNHQSFQNKIINKKDGTQTGTILAAKPEFAF